MDRLKQYWRHWVGKLCAAGTGLPELEKRYRGLLRELPMVPSAELSARLKRVTPPPKEGSLLVSWSDELSLAQVSERARRWEQGILSYERTEGPVVVLGVADYPCVFRRKHSEVGRADCEIYRLGYDRYIEWEREENHGLGGRRRLPALAQDGCPDISENRSTSLTPQQPQRGPLPHEFFGNS